jgi:predicted aspartyl protease
MFRPLATDILPASRYKPKWLHTAKPLCGYPDWFAVQQAQNQGKILSPLCKGELDAGEDHRVLAEAELNAVIKSAPQSTEAYQAHSALSHFYLRIGRFHEAEAQVKAMLASRPTAPDLANIRSLFMLLASHPDMTVVSEHAASIPSQTIAGNIFAPVTVNGSPRFYMLDTGMDLSFMSEKEAARLGLKAESSTTRMNDISGIAGAELRVVVVDDLVVGATHIRYVPFLVIADDNGAFVGLPPDQQGVLGIQPLSALGSLSFQANETLTISHNTARTVTTAPLLFVGTSTLTQIVYQGRTLPVTLDMGATQTTFNPPFAKLFPEVVRTGTNQNHDLRGLSKSTVQPSVSLPHLKFQFGRKVELDPATILLNQTTDSSAWAAANLGYDVMHQAKPFTLDFRRMKIGFTAPK